MRPSTHGNVSDCTNGVFFDGELTDGDEAIRIVGFNLKNFHKEKNTTKSLFEHKVIKPAESAAVGRGLMKQEVTTTDSTEVVLLTLWEVDVNTLCLGQSYQSSSQNISSLLPGQWCIC